MDNDGLPTTLDSWLARLEAAHPVGIDLGLERVACVAQRLGLTERPIARRVITVAGTNGKGSTVAMLEALGRAHGLSTAAYTSPHLVRYNERLRLDASEASDEVLIEGFVAVEQARLAPSPVSLTYFEVGTLAALWTIARRQPDLAVLEVGLGGRLDAVNVVDPDVAVVTTVAQDHAAFLGNDIAIIGREKAGIMRTGRPAVLGSRDLPSSVADHARSLGAPIFALGEAFAHSGRHASPQAAPCAGPDGEQGGWSWRGSDAQGQPVGLERLGDPGLPLDNAASALQALWLALGELDPDACRQALAEVRLPGRMQWRGNWCLDVGHNPHAANYLAGRLAERSEVQREAQGRTLCLIGMLEDKDAEGVIAALSPVVDAWLPVTLEGDRGRSAADLAARIEHQGGTILHHADSVDDGADWLESCVEPADRVLVTGSFFTVAAILARWSRQSSGGGVIEGAT
ncbi:MULTISPECIES: bifunctional tetrahydrofolate synthase/dihydrofolate synthase [unclassified Halomonas]|uniref:bifunctional tetrahydrofolate synthase/dihydrofolate synthase n=1 Tax=unclassified Halomonas TaxID=2609666 RepID=UPI0005FA44CE|nr:MULTISPECIES: bifunctional tetrahydrofolate synthase/dihydrofolate synthase [unclassified Halomonas]KJZ16430.1 folylpolyglutamate synthase [Halomonas sp. S2151]MCJ8287641.1 bifunctional tetrahydrofolate synthase/dihydrofolate synthase [Halomonas sp.]NQY72361.1 bifunctional tetrahydrofolate synthase/dihydrofolate synthase [Halomonas sp.]